MCVAICLVGGVLNIAVFRAGPAVVGFPDLRTTVPATALLLVAVLYTLPMAAWMRIRGMAWRSIGEMSAATVGLAVLLIALAAVGVLTGDQLHRWALAFCMPTCVVMLPVMLCLLRMYTGRTGSH